MNIQKPGEGGSVGRMCISGGGGSGKVSQVDRIINKRTMKVFLVVDEGGIRDPLETPHKNAHIALCRYARLTEYK